MSDFNHKSNICFDCKRACGGCSWSEVDDKTGKVKFEPVPGWIAEPTKLYLGEAHGVRKYGDTYKVMACPLFEEDRRR